MANTILSTSLQYCVRKLLIMIIFLEICYWNRWTHRKIDHTHSAVNNLAVYMEFSSVNLPLDSSGKYTTGSPIGMNYNQMLEVIDGPLLNHGNREFKLQL